MLQIIAKHSFIVSFLVPALLLAQSQTDYISDVKNKPVNDAREYKFTRTNGAGASGNLSVAGGNTVTLTPCPKGVKGTPGLLYKIRISGGTGTAESVLVTGGTCTSGAASGTLSFTTVNTHTGSWVIASTSDGAQEAVCGLPSAGGIVEIPTNITLTANVVLCGKTSVIVRRLAGAIISGSFTVLDVSSASANSLMETFHSAPDYAALTTIRDGSRTIMGNFPITAEFGSNTIPSTNNLLGGVDFPAGSTGGGDGIAGYARTASVNANAVGAFGWAGITADTLGSGAWSFNGVVTNCDGTSACLGNNGHDGVNLSSAEFDLNFIPLPGGLTPTGNAVGVSITGGSRIQPTGTAFGLEVRQMGIFDNIGWKDGIYLDDGAATNSGISIGTLGTGNNVNSMHLIFRSRNSGGTNNSAQIFSSAAGDLELQPNGSSWIVLNDGSLNPALVVKPSGSAPTVSISNALINATKAFASLGSVPAAGTAVYCTNCTTASTCAGSGSGHTAVSNGTNWTCQ